MNRPARLLRNRLERALEHIEDVERHLKRYPNDFHRLDRGTADGLLRRHSELAENIGQDIDVDALGKLADDASTLEYECMEFANTLEARLEAAGITWNSEFASPIPSAPARLDVTIGSNTYTVLLEQQPFTSGGYGAIYLGSCFHPPLRLAFKGVLGFGSEAENRKACSRLAEEAEVWQALDHPNVLPLYDVCWVRNQPWLVTPYCENGTILDYIRNKHLDDTAVVKLLHDVATGLEYIHAQSLIHGDIKAGNVVVNASGNAFLCDFGLARRVDEQTSHGQRWRGTVWFMSPERHMGAGKSKKDDVYAFGILIAQCMSRAILPSPYETYTSLEGKFLQDVIEKRMRPAISLHMVWNVAVKCWAHEAVDRPSMKNVAEWLSGINLG